MNRRGQGGGDRGRVGGFPFTPRSIAGLGAWYRADMGITLATGVSGWADQSGTGDANKNLSQGTAAAQPALVSGDAAYNGKPTIRFTAASAQFLQSPAWSAAVASPHTVFVVGNFDGTATNQYMLDGGATNEEYISTNNGASLAFMQNNGTGGIADAIAPAATVMAVCAVFNGASSSIYVNAKTPVGAGTTGTAARTAMCVGKPGGAFAGAYLNGKVAEVIFYSGALSANQVGSVLSYLGSRYAISIGS